MLNLADLLPFAGGNELDFFTRRDGDMMSCFARRKSKNNFWWSTKSLKKFMFNKNSRSEIEVSTLQWGSPEGDAFLLAFPLGPPGVVRVGSPFSCASLSKTLPPAHYLHCLKLSHSVCPPRKQHCTGSLWKWCPSTMLRCPPGGPAGESTNENQCPGLVNRVPQSQRHCLLRHGWWWLVWRLSLFRSGGLV